MKNIILVTILTLIINLVITTSIINAGSKYPDLLLKVREDLVNILKNNNIEVKDRSGSPWYYHSGSDGKYSLYFYRAEEMPEKAIYEVISACMNYYIQNGRTDRFRILLFSQTIQERNKSGLFFKSVKPYFKLTIGGEQ